MWLTVLVHKPNVPSLGTVSKAKTTVMWRMPSLVESKWTLTSIARLLVGAVASAARLDAYTQWVMGLGGRARDALLKHEGARHNHAIRGPLV